LSEDQDGTNTPEATERAPKRRRRWIAVAAVVAVVAGACTTIAVVNRDESTAKASTKEDSPLLETPTTKAKAKATTTAAPATTTTTVALPTPAPPPADPYEKTEIKQIGSIYIPKIGLQHALFEGVSLTVIDHGPGHWPGTAMPGQVGNTVFPGHRVTHSHPFLNLDLLSPGDQVIFQMPEADYVYSVVRTDIVSPTDMYVIDQGTTPTFTLIACHPKHSARQRIVVKGNLIATIPKNGG
jgi:sortase A